MPIMSNALHSTRTPARHDRPKGMDTAMPDEPLRNRDDAEFERLTDRHRRELLVHCYRMLGSFEDAEDILQEALLRAWRGLETLQQQAAVRAWLYRIATNTCLDAI